MAEPTSPRWPATKIRLDGVRGETSDILALRSATQRYLVPRANQRELLLRQFQIVLHHGAHQGLISDLRLPTEHPARLARVALERVHFGGAEIARVFFHARLPFDSSMAGGQFQ